MRRPRAAGLTIIPKNELLGNAICMIADDDTSHEPRTRCPVEIPSHPDLIYDPCNLNSTSGTTRHGSQPAARAQPSPALYGERRQKRYSSQETALRATFQRCDRETSRRGLQIRSLERAAALLDAHVKEARERVKELRKALLRNDLDAEIYKTLQQQRWLEEHRWDARTEELTALRQLMPKLSNTEPESTPLAQCSPSNASLSKGQTNLLLFSQKSPTKLIFHHRRDAALNHSVLHRRLILTRPQPITLRPSALPLPTFTKPPKNSRMEPSRPDLFISSRAGNSQFVSSGSTVPSPVYGPLAPTSMTVAEVQSTRSLASLGFVNNNAGVATIYTIKVEQPQASREQLELAMDDVGLPSYAIDLLGGLDDIHGDISLLPMPNSSPVDSQNSKKSLGRSRFRDSFAGSSLTTQTQHSLPPAPRLSPTTPRVGMVSALRRPISTMFSGHKRRNSDSSGGVGSVRMSGEGVVLAERPTTPSGSTHSADKHDHRWGAATLSANTPAKAFSKMKNRLSMLGGKR